MLLALLFLFQHVILPDLPTVDKNPYTSGMTSRLAAGCMRAGARDVTGRAETEAKGANLAIPSLPRGASDLALYRVIRYGLPETEMPSHNMTQREIWQIAGYVRTLGQSGEGAAPGDAKKGSALLRGKGRCLQCHVLDGDGGHLGPSLTDIGQRRSPAYLRTKLMNPGADPLSNSTLVTLTTQDGRQVTGMWMNEDTWSIQIRDDRLGLHSYWKQDLKELSVEHRALMPSYAKQFSDQELGDIVAFLSATGGRP